MKSDKPKVAHELLGKPLVRWVVDAAKAAGCTAVHAVIGTGKEQVEPLLADCVISYQLDMLGTGHTVMCAADAFEGFDGAVVVLCGDAPLISSETIRALIEAHAAAGNAMTVLTMHPGDPTGYGRIVRDESGLVTGIVEQKDATPQQRAIRECNTGVYCFDASALFGHLGALGRDNAQGEYYLTDMLAVLAAAGCTIGAVAVDDDEECIGINSRSQLAQASRIAQRRINERLMAEGATMLDPSLVWVGPDVQVGCDVELLPMSMLMGATSVESGCTIGPNTRLTDCRIGQRCSVEETVAVQAVLEDDVSCGPRAYLRPGTHVCSGAHIGTHVELKNATVGQGSKVPHLSYIGDATLGRDVNIGAGTITCNYDGTRKNRTTIGDRSFIGSDTMLVAPVTVGSDAVTGASSCITRDVPDGALGIERSEQANIEGYTARHAAG